MVSTLLVYTAGAAMLAAPAEVTRRQAVHMATEVSITIAQPESPEVLGAIEAAFAEVARLEVVLSEWKPGSDASKVVASAGQGAVRVGPELLSVLQIAQEVSTKTEGAFDVTVGALWGAWDFRWRSPRIPTASDLKGRTARINYRWVTLDPCAQTAALQRPGMKLALGGITKGYIIDSASTLLRNRGFPNHLVEAGGDLYASGSKRGKPWRVGIRGPDGKGLYGTLEVQDEAIATSGNYEKFFFHEGVRYHHILDPATGMPARGLASVTVRAQSAVLADAFATAIFVAGPARGLKIAAAERKLDVLLFLEDTLRVAGTPEFMARVLRN